MEIVTKFLEPILKLLPTSPFRTFISAISDIPFLGYLNYFIPIDIFIAVGQAWLVSIGIFYLYSIILRWIRAIQ